MDSTAANQMLQKAEEDFFNVIESPIDLSQYFLTEMDPLETMRYGNDSPPPPPCRSARMNLGIFRDIQRPEIVNSSIPILDTKRKRDIEKGDGTTLTYIKKRMASEEERNRTETVSNEASASATSRTEITCDRLPSISLFAVGEPTDINSPIDEDSLTMPPTYSMYNDAFGGGAEAMENAYTEELESVAWIAAPHATNSYLFAARTQDETEIPIW